ncbi:MAG: phage scaffolding protein [Clostridia bacterium]|nr:phage scaffolding protein [Clostridia bacterium]
MLNSKIPTLKPNIQLFAEGDPAPAEPDPAPAAEPAPAPGGKVFSEDYVRTLRNESAGHRTTAKKYEAALKTVFGIDADAELGDDLEGHINALNQRNEAAQQDALKKANNRLIAAELRSRDGYDHKLLEKVIDLSKVTVDDNGEVKGLDDAIKAAETEFPAVKKTDTPPPYAGGTGSNTVNSTENLNDEIARKLFGKD